MAKHNLRLSSLTYYHMHIIVIFIFHSSKIMPRKPSIAVFLKIARLNCDNNNIQEILHPSKKPYLKLIQHSFLSDTILKYISISCN